MEDDIEIGPSLRAGARLVWADLFARVDDYMSLKAWDEAWDELGAAPGDPKLKTEHLIGGLVHYAARMTLQAAGNLDAALSHAERQVAALRPYVPEPEEAEVKT